MTTCAALHADEPTDALDGLLCRNHGWRLRDLLGAREGLGEPGREHHGLPWMWEHLEQAMPSLTQGQGSGGGSWVRDREAEQLASVIALRADIRDWLGEVAADLMKRLPAAGPAKVRLSTSVTSRRYRGADWDVVQRSATWLLAQADALLSGRGLPEDVARAAVAATLDTASQLASRAHALAPWRPAPTVIEGIPCRCGSVGSVHDYGDYRICQGCSRKYDDHEWDVLMAVLSRRFGTVECACGKSVPLDPTLRVVQHDRPGRRDQCPGSRVLREDVRRAS